MRELSFSEISEVNGAGLNFTSVVTLKMLNNVADATSLGRAVGAAFGLGYAAGTFLNDRFDLSTKIVDAITG